ncbi:sensor histidine kinase [Fulvivirga sp. M361]|uniref:sensor histidine kinase n=1 Tax=Fulvivirga sp. M361 TaxID=2594266 RepID=UPI00117A2A0C|nr:sensor histidine kinase [Fulvivirga sp. M361]TRX54842.1 sensor histidine kinase [Fulvivirga sp. M361]
MVLVLGTILLIGLMVLIYYGNRKLKKSNIILIDQKVAIARREKEKALLLKELNHRVKNNLQLVSSLLSLQGRQPAHKKVKEALMKSRSRVEALSLVHAMLYRQGADTKVDLSVYIKELALNLCHYHKVKLKLSFNMDSISMNIDKAVSLSLIVNELISNALKYAYPDISNPRLTIALKEIDQQLIIDVIDNGIGFKDHNSKGSFGLYLIKSLTKQLGGSFEKVASPGTHWKVILRYRKFVN